MSSSDLKISVITVCFNSESTIGHTIRSVNEQTYPNVEHVFIDGASKDGTLDIIRESSSVDKIVVSEPDKGIYDAMNTGLAAATGDIICILNSDDFYPNKEVLSSVAIFFSSNIEIDLLLGSVDFIGDDSYHVVRRVNALQFQPWMFRFGFMPPHPGVFARADVLNRVGPYKLGYKIAADFDWLVRALIAEKVSFVASKETYVRMRLGGASTSGWASISTITHEMLQSLIENNVYSNTYLLNCRLPIKWATQVLGQLV